MRFSKYRTLVLFLAILAIYKLWGRGDSTDLEDVRVEDDGHVDIGRKNGQDESVYQKRSGENRVVRSDKSRWVDTDPLQPFAGTDVVVYHPSATDEVFLQGFNIALKQTGLTYSWAPKDRSFSEQLFSLDRSMDSLLKVGGLRGIDEGVYVFEFTISDEDGHVASDDVAIHVKKRTPLISSEDNVKYRQEKLGKRLIVTLPETTAQVTAVDEQMAKKHGMDTFVWEKDSNSPMDGKCIGQRRKAKCMGLVEGVYRYSVLASGKRVKAIIPVVVSVHSDKMRIYAHHNNYNVNQGLLPVYIKKEPVVPVCDPDNSFKRPTPDEDLLLGHLKQRAVDNTIVIGFTGDSYLKLAKNWLCSVRGVLGNTGYMVVAFDSNAQKAMLDLEVSLGGDPNAVHYDARMLEGHNMKFKPKTKDATKAWKEIMSVKTTLIEAIIRHGYNVFVLDADTVLLQNPMDYVQSRTSQCDFQWQADGKSKFLWKDLQSRTHFNAGVYYALSNERTKLMYRKWLEAYSCQKGRREQHALTLVLHNTHRGAWTLHEPGTAIRDVPESIVKFCYLDPQRFPDGGFFVFHQDYVEAFDDEPGSQYLMHANNLEQDETAKMNALKQYNAWFLDKSDETCA